MKHILSLLSFIFLLSLNGQTYQEINTVFSFPFNFNENGSALFYTDWNSYDNGFLWTEGGEIHNFTGGKSRDLSFGINRVVGTIKKEVNGEEIDFAAYLNSGSQEWVSLGVAENIPISNSYYSSSWGINEAGDKIVGLIFKSVIHADAFLWTEESGYTILPNIEQNSGSRANGISKKGDVIYGHVIKENGTWTPCVWVDGGVIQITDSDGFGDSSAASYDGTYVAGNIESDLFIWSKDNIQNISLTDQDFIDAELPIGSVTVTAITEDKKLFGIVGNSQRKTFVWTEGEGLQSLNSYIKNHGITGLDDFNFSSTVSATKDGKILAGSGLTSQNQFRTYILKFGNVSTTDLEGAYLNAFVYPTIVDEEVNINFSAVNTPSKSGIINVINQEGRVVFKETVDSSKNIKKINLSHLNKGIYIINLKIGAASESFKIMKK